MIKDRSTRTWVFFLKNTRFFSFQFKKNPACTWPVFQNNLIHTYTRMRAARPCQSHAKPRGGGYTLIIRWLKKCGLGALPEVAQQSLEGETYVWTDNEVELLLNIAPERKVNEEMPSDAKPRRSSVMASCSRAEPPLLPLWCPRRDYGSAPPDLPAPPHRHTTPNIDGQQPYDGP